jgi:DNA polymerase-3 subunit delta'
VFEGFYGNTRVTQAISRMIQQDRLPQTLLLAGPEGVGKATLARRLAAALLDGERLIEQDDLSLPGNLALIQEREKWPSERRAEEPLFFSTHPDFVTFAPDGPLRQISIQQMRLLKNRAQFKPQSGSHRVFLIDQLDRANEQAANSLLKTLEEPPDHLTVVATADNPHSLLPTIRSRAVAFQLVHLAPSEMAAFLRNRNLDESERRIRLAAGCPGRAVALDLDEYDRRRTAMLGLLQVAAGVTPFADWMEHADSLAAAREEKLEFCLTVLYGLLGDVLSLRQPTSEICNVEIEADLKVIAGRVSFNWIREAVQRVDELRFLLRRNIQKSIALDALVLGLRSVAETA